MLKTGSAIVSIYTEMTPNPETMKFVANKLLYPGKSIDFPDETSAGPSPLAQELFGFPFVRGVFIASNFVTLTKMTRSGPRIEPTHHGPDLRRQRRGQGRSLACVG